MHHPPPNTQPATGSPSPTYASARYPSSSTDPPYPSHSSPPASPRDAPSVESFTQSQLGDDERSEESEPKSRQFSPRTSTSYFKRGHTSRKGSRAPQDTGTVGAITSESFDKAASADTWTRSPKETYTPRSTTSSNKTPTQLSFNEGSLPATLYGGPGLGDRRVSQHATRKEFSAQGGDGDHTRQIPSSPSRFSSPISYSREDRTFAPAGSSAVEKDFSKKQGSGDSKSTIRNVTGDPDSIGVSKTPPQSRTLPIVDLDRTSRAPARMNALAASEVSPPKFRQSSGTQQSSTGPVPSSRHSLGIPRPSENFSMRGPSIDTQPDHLHIDRPPSPVSPTQSTDQEVIETRGRIGPIHYGPDHDFVPDSGHHRSSRSRSVSRARRSQDSQRPSIHEYSAFRNSGEILSQPYAERSSRDPSPMLRQHAPEYQIDNARSPIEWPSESIPSESRSRSRRGSRSSAFFKSFASGNPPQTDEPPLPTSPRNEVSSPPINSSTPGDRKSKRSSVFRSLTGTSGSGSASAQSKENVPPNPKTQEHSQIVESTLPAPAPPPPQVEDDEFPSRGNPRTATSKLSKRLQRSSTSANAEQDSSKKKRFSGIGVSIVISLDFSY